MNCGSLDIHLQGNEENNFAEVKEMYPNTFINMMHNLAVGFNPPPPPPPQPKTFRNSIILLAAEASITSKL